MPKEPKVENFEDVYAKLEAVVAKLEQGGLSLEQAIELYEEGMTLARNCQERLDGAEQKITKLRESFASLPERNNGTRIGETIEDYEYIAENDDAPVEDDVE